MSSIDVQEFKKEQDFQNNTNISLANKYVYLAVDKVANSTIKKCLYEVEYIKVGWSVGGLYDPRNSPLIHPFQLPDEQLNAVLTGDEFYKFCIVRNPYSRLLSCYLDRILTLKTRPSKQFRKALGKNDFDFNDFVKTVCSQDSNQQNSHWRVQSDDVLFDLINYSHIGYFENLASEMEYLSFQIFGKFLPQMNIKSKNHSPKKTGSDDKVYSYFDQYHADMVFERYKKDFDNFCYSKLVL